MRGVSRPVLGRVCSWVLSFVLIAGPAVQAVPAFASEGAETRVASPSAISVSDETTPAPTVVEEIKSQRTETATSYYLSDGNVKTVISEAPIRFKDGKGAWNKIDTTLVPGDTFGEVESASTSMTASFGTQTQNTPPVMLEGDGFSVGVNMLGVAENTKLVSGDTVNYLADVGRGVTLEYQALSDGIKETLVLANAGAPTEFEFSLALDGLELRKNPAGGGYGFYRPGESQAVLSLGELSIIDSAGGSDPMASAVCTDATMTVASIDSDTVKIRYEVSPSWLKDPARVFPVKVDPSILSPASDTWVHEGYPDLNKWTADYMCAGVTDDDRLWSFVKFDIPTSLSAAYIVSSHLNLYQCYVTGGDTTVDYGAATSAFSSSTTWNTNRPTYTKYNTITGLPSGQGWVSIWCSNLVKEWISGSRTNYGFGLRRDLTGTKYRRFWTKEYTSDTSKRPYLEIIWAPQPVTNLSSTQTPSTKWFREVDRDNNGRADTPNDLPDAGRGSINLSWSASSLAVGYNIYLNDGNTYRKVGNTVGNGATSWSTAGGRFFPKDSDYASKTDNSWSADPFDAAIPLQLSRRIGDPIEVNGEGTGVVVSDGRYLYYRAWNQIPGQRWTRVGTGAGDTTLGEEYGTIGPDFPTQPTMSAFYLDGMIYNGFAVTSTTIKGIPVSAASGSTETATFTFSAPLIDRTTGLASANSNNNVLLAAADERIYSVAYNLGHGDVKDGFRIREFDRNGDRIGTADHDIVMSSKYIDGVIADGNNLYLIGWNGVGNPTITKVSTATWKVTGQWLANWQGTREINGCYDAVNNCFWMGAYDEGHITRYKGLGLDLRDNPNELYKKTTGTTLDGVSYYKFVVAPYDGSGNELPWANCTPVTQQINNRTIGVNDDPRHTSYELGTMDGHEAFVNVDDGTLELDVTDLSIASWGPQAALTRHYSSGKTTAGAYAPGWSFNFEQNLNISGTLAQYTDGQGEVHRYTYNTTTSTWAPPNGDYSTLAPDGTGYKITFKDDTVIRFDSAGRLTSETDNNGNQVAYTWNAERTHLTIEAANSQSIEATFNAGGRILGADYTTDAGQRLVEYDYGEGYSIGGITVVRWWGGTDQNRVACYGYVRDWEEDVLRLQEISEPRFLFAGIYGANWQFSYEEPSNALSEIEFPAWDTENDGNNENTRQLTFTYSANTATVTGHATVGGVENTAVERLYQWNPTGTEAWHSNNRSVESTAALEKWQYTYTPQNEAASQTTPDGVATRSMYDSRGNVIYDFDGKGGVTTNVYDSSDNLVRTVSPAGRATYSFYDSNGNLTVEERVLTAAGERSRTEYTYDTYGRTIGERSRIDATSWAVTEYSDFAPNGEAQEVTQCDVKLSLSSQPIDLTTTKAFDGFGNLLWEKDATGMWVSRDNAYDIVGRPTESTDASGVVTYHTYDLFGNESETWRSDGAQRVDGKTSVYTADGWLYTERNDGDPTVTHTYDAMGNEVTTEGAEGTTQTQYDAEGQATAQTTPGTTAAAIAVYSASGLVTRVIAASASEADETEYDDNEQVVSEDPSDADETIYEYDADGNETSTTNPTEDGSGATSTSAYDVGGRLIKSTDAKGFVTTYSYDQLDRQLAATTSGKVASKVYNTLGWVLTETDLDGSVKAFVYDNVGRVTSESLDGQITNTEYDGMGRPIRTTKPDGSEITYQYDAFSRALRETHTKGSATLRDIIRSFDQQGRELTVTDAITGLDSSSSWGGDIRFGLTRRWADTTLTASNDAQGKDNLDTSSKIGSVDTTRNVLSRDSAGRPTVWALDAGTGLSAAAVYDQAGKIISQTITGSGTDEITYEYSDATARQSREKIDLEFPGDGGDLDRSYSYDDAGRLISAADAGGATHSFSYTADGSITSAEGRTFTYDANGRIATMTEGSVITAFTFDSRGRRIGQESSTQAIQYTYDDADRLVGFSKDVGNDESVDVLAAYTYDANGQRTCSAVTSGSVETTTTYLYDGLTLLSAQSVSNGATTTVDYVVDGNERPYGAYVSFPDSAEPIFVWLVTSVRGDILGSLSASGTPVFYRSYMPYGALRVSGSDGAAAGQVNDVIKLRFAGYTFDEESGLYYCSQRYYDPVTCQWTTKDPAKADGEESAYQYCGSDPINAVDPTGFYAEYGYYRWSNTRIRDLGYWGATRRDNCDWRVLGVTVSRIIGIPWFLWQKVKPAVDLGRAFAMAYKGDTSLLQTAFLNLHVTASTWSSEIKAIYVVKVKWRHHYQKRHYRSGKNDSTVRWWGSWKKRYYGVAYTAKLKSLFSGKAANKGSEYAIKKAHQQHLKMAH